jgi:Peptidase A4 family
VNKTLAGAANSSAEVIVEAPCCTASGGILPLAHFSPVTFTNATVDGSAVGNSSPTQIIMVNGSGQAKDSISSLSGGNSFKATWLRAN